MKLQASKKYLDKMAGVKSELQAPRKIIGWLIGATVINSIMIGYVIWLLSI